LPANGLGHSSGRIPQRGWRTEGLFDYSNRSQTVSNARRKFSHLAQKNSATNVEIVAVRRPVGQGRCAQGLVTKKFPVSGFKFQAVVPAKRFPVKKVEQKSEVRSKKYKVNASLVYKLLTSYF
jgi:hypothetical protein